VNSGIILILAAVTTPAPSPTPAAADPCGATHTALLSAINRPTIGFSACAVKLHDIVVEAGYANQSGGQPEAVYPQGFIRYGAAPNLELDIAGPSGNFDSGFGAKYEFWHNDVAAFGADFLYTMPTGSAAFTNGVPVEALNLDYGTAISSRFGAGTTIGISRNGAQMALLPSVVVTNAFNDRTQLYAEAYGSAPLGSGSGGFFGLNGGVQYLLSPQLEIDAEMGRVVNNVNASHYIGFGFGVRL
jgi:hypothetical protein